MAVLSAFFDDVTYYAQSFADVFKGFLTNGIAQTGDGLQVRPHQNMTVTVASGVMHINGHFFGTDAQLTANIQMASGTLGRIDRVVIRENLTSNCMELVVLTGIPAEIPAPPELIRNGTYYDMCLAEVRVPAGTTTITAGHITDTRADNSLCGGMCARTNDVLLLAGKADKYVESAVTAAQSTADLVYNQCPYRHKAEYTESSTWVCPAGVTRVAVWIVDGSDGGEGGVVRGLEYSNAERYVDGKSSEDSACTLHYNVAVTPGMRYTVTIGAGGTGQTYSAVGGPLDTEPTVTSGATSGGRSSALGLTVVPSGWGRVNAYETSPETYGNGSGADQHTVKLSGSQYIAVNGRDGHSGRVVIYY